MLKVEIDQYRIEKFLETGHPRTVSIVMGALPSKNAISAGMSITQLTVDGAPIIAAR